jgi:histidyl-tRNA synthetase
MQTMYLEKAKPDKQIGHAFENSIPMILWLGEEELKTRQAKLKILYKHEEVKVGLDGLAQNVLPYVLQFRTDFEEGKVQLEDPKKAKPVE